MVKRIYKICKYEKMVFNMALGTDEAQNQAETRVCSYPAPFKNHLLITQLAVGFAAKGLLNLLTSSPVATGLAH